MWPTPTPRRFSCASLILTQDPESALKRFNARLAIDAEQFIALYGRAKSLDVLAAEHKDNVMLRQAIEAYEHLLDRFSEKLPDLELQAIGNQCIKLMRFIGKYK